MGNEQNVWWTYRNNTLTIAGTGPMADYAAKEYQIGAYEYHTNSPWDKHQGYIRELSIQEGVTRIGRYAFFGLQFIDQLYIPASLESVGSGAFRFCKSLQSLTFAENGNLTTIEADAFRD